jgi:hypothetical protein
MLGTRIFQIVTKKFTDPKIDEEPTITMAKHHRVWGRLAVISLRGG